MAKNFGKHKKTEHREKPEKFGGKYNKKHGRKLKRKKQRNLFKPG